MRPAGEAASPHPRRPTAEELADTVQFERVELRSSKLPQIAIAAVLATVVLGYVTLAI